MTVSVGGEIGEVGKENSNEEELLAYLDGYRAELERAGAGRASGSARSASRPARPTAACRCRTAAWPRSSSTSTSSARLGEVARDARARRGGPARRLDPPRRAVPPVPGGRDGRDPPRDRVPERALRAPGLPEGAPRADRALVLRERRRRAEAGPDRRAVRLHDAEEGDRAVQARAVGPRRRRTRSSRRSDGRSRSSSRSSASTGRARWSSGTSSRSSSGARSRRGCARPPRGPPAERGPAAAVTRRGVAHPPRDAARLRGDRSASSSPPSRIRRSRR